MPYCRKCGYEYVAGVTVCPDCSTPLTPEEPVLCDRCGEEVEPDDRFCGHCGVLREGEAACAVHPDAAAVGCCVICETPLCGDCARERNGRFFCSDDEHLKAAFHWVSACTVPTEYEAEMIRSNLESAGIAAIVLRQSDSMYVTSVAGLAVTEVMVPVESLEDARAFLRSADTAEPPATEEP